MNPPPAPANAEALRTATGEMVHALDHLHRFKAPPSVPTGKCGRRQHDGNGRRLGGRHGQKPRAVQGGDFTSWGIIKSPHYLGGIFGLAFSPDGKSLLCCGMGEMRDPMAGNGKMIWQRWAWSETPARMETQIAMATRDRVDGNDRLCPRPQSFLMAGRQAQGNWNAALFLRNRRQIARSLDTKSRITRHFSPPMAPRSFWVQPSASPPARRQMARYGQIHLVKISDAG